MVKKNTIFIFMAIRKNIWTSSQRFLLLYRSGGKRAKQNDGLDDKQIILKRFASYWILQAGNFLIKIKNKTTLLCSSIDSTRKECLKNVWYPTEYQSFYCIYRSEKQEWVIVLHPTELFREMIYFYIFWNKNYKQ